MRGKSFAFGLVFAVLVWPFIVFDESRRAFRRWRSSRTYYGDIARNIVKMDRKLREDVEKFIRQNPKCPGCGIEGKLEQYRGSVWVKCQDCGRRVFTPDPSVPESVDQAPAPLVAAVCPVCGGEVARMSCGELVPHGRLPKGEVCPGGAVPMTGHHVATPIPGTPGRAFIFIDPPKDR